MNGLKVAYEQLKRPINGNLTFVVATCYPRYNAATKHPQEADIYKQSVGLQINTNLRGTELTDRFVVAYFYSLSTNLNAAISEPAVIQNDHPETNTLELFIQYTPIIIRQNMKGTA